MSSRAAVMNQIARRVVNMMTVKRVHRIRMLSQTITDGVDGNANCFNILTCDDDPNYDLTTDGTNVAEVEPGARIVAMQLHMTIYNLPANRLVEWYLGKDPDASLLTSNFTIANLYQSDVSAVVMALRKNIIAVGHVIATTNKDQSNVIVNIPRKALARIARMADGDVIRLCFADDSTGTVQNPNFYLRGRIITRGP